MSADDLAWPYLVWLFKELITNLDMENAMDICCLIQHLIFFNDWIISSPPGQNGSHFTNKILIRFCMLIKVCPEGPNSQKPSIGLNNGLVPNRRQAIIWTNADLIHWCIYVALGGDELMCKITGRSTHMVSELLFMASRTSWYFSHTFAYLKVINYFEIVTNCSHYYSFLCWCLLQLQCIVMLHFVVDPSLFFRELQSLNCMVFHANMELFVTFWESGSMLQCVDL